jgi:hypothetical protein
MLAHHKLFATTPGRKITRPKEPQSGLAGVEIGK